MTLAADFKQAERLNKEVQALEDQLEQKRKELATLSESLMQRLEENLPGTTSTSTTSSSRSRSATTKKRRSTKRISGRALQNIVGGGMKNEQLLAALTKEGYGNTTEDAEAKVKGLLDRSDTPPIVKRGTTWKVNADYQEQRGKGKRKRRK